MGLFGKKPLWGLDIGSRSIKGVQVARTRKGIELVGAGIYEFPEEGGSVGEGLATVVGTSVTGVRAAVQFSGKVAPVIRHISLPVMPSSELTEAIRWEARKFTSLPMEEVVIDSLVLGETGEKAARRNDIVVVVVERAALLSQLEWLKGFGLEVVAVDVAAFALRNLLQLGQNGDGSGSLLLVDIGAQRMEITILKGGVIRVCRQVAVGGDLITAALSESLGVSFEEAERRKREEGLNQAGPLLETFQGQADRLIVEVQRSLDYYRAQFREPGVDRILLMGGTPLLPGFQAYFSGFFDAPVQLEDPLSPLRCRDPGVGVLRSMAPRLALAMGLALRTG